MFFKIGVLKILHLQRSTYVECLFKTVAELQFNKWTSGNITTSVSDHLTLLIIIENFEGKISNIKNLKVTIRDYKNVNKRVFSELY